MKNDVDWWILVGNSPILVPIKLVFFQGPLKTHPFEDGVFLRPVEEGVDPEFPRELGNSKHSMVTRGR